MKAIVIREFGPPEVMRLEEVPTPVPEAGEVLIEVRAVSVNRTLDLAVRSGAYAVPVKLPHVLGVDPSGVVAAVGPGVTARKPGDRVATLQFVRPPAANSFPVILGLHVWGGYAQYVKVPVACTHPIPDGVDFPVATVVARHAPVAFSLLRDIAGLKSGDWVLVMGASGGLGSAGIQVAKYLGAKVIAAAGADERVKAAVGLGGRRPLPRAHRTHPAARRRGEGAPPRRCARRDRQSHPAAHLVVKRSTERFLTTHAGSLPRPEGLVRMMYAKEEGVPVDDKA